MVVHLQAVRCLVCRVAHKVCSITALCSIIALYSVTALCMVGCILQVQARTANHHRHQAGAYEGGGAAIQPTSAPKRGGILRREVFSISAIISLAIWGYGYTSTKGRWHSSRRTRNSTRTVRAPRDARTDAVVAHIHEGGVCACTCVCVCVHVCGQVSCAADHGVVREKRRAAFPCIQLPPHPSRRYE